MPGKPEFLAQRLMSEGEKTSSFFASLSESEWRTAVYSEGAEWRVRDILAHFVTAEQSFLKLFENIRNGGEGASADFSIERFNSSQVAKAQGLTTDELREIFIDVRRKMAAWVSALDESDLEKVGRHPFLGVTTLEEMIKLVYRHNQIHFRDIRKVLDA